MLLQVPTFHGLCQSDKSTTKRGNWVCLIEKSEQYIDAKNKMGPNFRQMHWADFISAAQP